MPTQTHLYQEINQQPNVLSRFLKEEINAVKNLANAIKERNISHVVIAARGTSDNAARYAQYLMGAVNKLPVALATPSLFSIYKQMPKFGQALVLGISQSGKSPDIVAVLNEAKKQGVLTATITNFSNSDLAAQADHVINLQAGEEKAVAATKTYTSELTAIALLSTTLANNTQMLSTLQQLPQLLETTLTLNTDIAQMAQRYRYMQRCVVIGRGYNYATAFELALKLKELTYIVVEPYSSADFLHGPLAIIEHGFPVIAIAPEGAVLPEMLQFMQTVKDRGAELVSISNNKSALAMAHTPLALPTDIPEWLSPVMAIVPGQLLALHLAHTCGYNVDQPRGLKKVTETK